MRDLSIGRLRRSLATVLATCLLLATVTLGSVDRADAASGVVNTYQTATVVGGTPDSSALSAGDCALVIQMTGTIANGLGVYEILDPANSAPTRTYSGSEAVQFVILPGGCGSAQTVDAGGVTAPAWNGTTGGVVFMGGTTLNLSDTIDVSGTGYASEPAALGPNAGSDGCTLAGMRIQHPSYPGASGGGGIFGGGGGSPGSAGRHMSAADAAMFPEAHGGEGGGGTTTAGGYAGFGGTHSDFGTSPDGCVGGAAGAPGNGAGTFNMDTAESEWDWGSSGGGGSYGGGGSACAAYAAAAYSPGGSGGGSWSGGGAAGAGGVHYTRSAFEADGMPGNVPEPAAITTSDHYLHDGDARLVMGGAGGSIYDTDGALVNVGGRGGGIVVLDFTSVTGGAILANGADGERLGALNSGTAGGAGGQVLVATATASGLDIQADGGDGASPGAGGSHVGVGGAGGGGGGIWLRGEVSAVETNTGPNYSEDSGEPSAPMISGVTWSVSGGYAPGGVLPPPWTGGFDGQIGPDGNPKGGFGCGSGSGGDGLIRVSDPASPQLSIEKATNGLDSDVAPGATLATGQVVTWTYVVTVLGAGDATDVTVTDDIVAAGDIACDVDGDGTFESSNNVGTITAPATFTCEASGTADTLNYANVATVNGDFGGEALDPDTDPSHYTIAAPSITVEKQTEGAEADSDLLNDGSEDPASTSDGASNPLAIGSPVTWDFQITNDGAVPLANVAITDATTTANDQAHALTITCVWASSSDGATTDGYLSVGETVPCSATGIAGTGLHENTATVTGDAAGTQDVDANGDPVYDGDGNPVFTPNGDGTFDAVATPGGDPIEVSDADASGYFGAPPSIDIVKTVTGTADGETAAVVAGQAVGWTFVVTNDGAGNLDNVTVDDPILTGLGSAITCDWANSSDAGTGAGTLSPLETVTCTATSVAAGGVDLENTASASGDPADGGPAVTDDDPANYVVGVPAIEVVKTTCTDPDDVPASCSDGPLIPVGDPLVWLYVIENTGEVTLVDVTLGDNLEAGVDATACDWTNSTDVETGDNVLSVGETVSCTQAGVAGIGDYDNVGDVAGTPGSDDGTAYLTPGGDPVDAVTDDDPSDYFGLPAPAIDVEKDTNGVQADDPGSEPVIFEGDAVTWTFVVTNTGNVDLADVAVTDVVTTDNGTVAGTVVCDWAGTSTDPLTPDRNLSVGEEVTCTATSTAELGLYNNNATVTGTPVADATTTDPDAPVRLTDENGADIDDVDDTDPSGYFGPDPSIDIEKDTNGTQADVIGDQDTLQIGDDVTWTFEVANDGNVDLANVIVSDTVTTDNGTVADPAGVVCDWANSSDPATPDRNLSVGETVTCTSTSVAAAGQYANNADVVGTPVADATTADPDAPVALTDLNGVALGDVVDDDPSHYYGEPLPAIDIEKDTNGNQADTFGEQDYIAIDDAVVWTFEVENTGNVDLAGVIVSDTVTTDNGTVADPAGVVCDWANSSDPATPDRNLSVGETVTCTSNSIAEPGQYANNADVTGTPVADATTADPDAPVALQDIDGVDLIDVTDNDPSHYYGLVMPAIDIEKDTNGVQADDPGSEPVIFEGDTVTWTFVVVNTGNVALGNVIVTDAVTTDNGTVAGTVVCDWAGSSDPATAADILSVDEEVTCTATSTAELGLYNNNSNVVGTPLANDGTPLLGDDGVPVPNVSDTDPSGYFGPDPSIDIEKDTNGTQADVIGDQDTLQIGDDVTWTFEVANDGNVDLANVIVSDTVTTDNGTVADPAGVVCDWANSSDPATPDRNLSVGETVTCTSTSVAAAGQYANNADVVGTPVADATTADPDAPVALTDLNGVALGDVVDDDPSHYYGEPLPAIDIEKDTNGNQADTFGEQDYIAIDDAVVWTFEVENTGNVDLAGVIVSDTVTTDNGTVADPAGVVCDWANSSDPATPDRNLSVGETVTCTSNSIAEPGQYANNADVTGTPVADATTADPDAPVALQDIDGVDLIDVTDNDPSHYYGLVMPAIDIEKDTNGVQADDPGSEPVIFEGDTVTWTFVVVNTGNVALGNVIVTDAVTTDNGTVAGTVVCDWAGSSDPATAADILSVDEEVTCTATSTAELGLYNNNSNVVGTPLANDGTPLLGDDGVPVPNVSDTDPSGYFGPDPSIDIEKDTNGTQADVIGDQDTLQIGDDVTWTFEVANDGNVDLANVIVSDTVTTDNGTVADPAGVVCDWANSSDPATPDRNLSVGETVTCTSTSVAAAGQYANNADVVGTPVADATTADPDAPVALTDLNGVALGDVVDDDPSHYYGEPLPAIDIEKDTNGNQADTVADQDNIVPGDDVTWTFVVTNDGNVDLANVVVTDTVTTDNGTVADPAGVVCDWANSSDPATPDRNLSVGETVTCTSNSTAAPGQYANNADVVGTPVEDATTADPDAPDPMVDEEGNALADVVDDDPSHYFGATDPSIDIEKDTNGNQADTVDDQEYLAIGSDVTWTFVVTNIGNVDLAGVVVTDTITTDNGTVTDPAGVVCDWATSSDPATPDRNLSVGETVTCTASSSAVAGQYANNADVSGTPVQDATTADPDDPEPIKAADGSDLADVVDEDPSHYFGPIMDLALVKTLKDGGNDQDVKIGDEVTFVITVINQGNVAASGIEIVDYLPEGLELADPNWTIGPDGALYHTDGRVLQPGEEMTVELKVKVTGPPDGDAFEVEAEIAKGDAVNNDGEVIMITTSEGNLVPIVDIDSIPDANNDEDAEDDVTDNTNGDEDDHDRIGLTLVTTPTGGSILPAPDPIPSGFTKAPPAPAKPPSTLALTGANTRLLALLGALMVLTGASFVTAADTRRRNRHKK